MIKKLSALVLAALLVIGAMAGNVAAEELYTRTADPSTLDSWQELFGTDINDTSNAGHVWTDKTVLKNDAAFSNVSTSQARRGLNMADADNNFLVALSTMASSKSIVGHDTLPTDTVFVLDLSSSMYPSLTPDRVEEMVAAVNNATDTLLRLNPYNRVGVVLYYGAGSLVSSTTTKDHYTPLLPLDHYVTRDSKDYLLVEVSNNQLNSIYVNEDVRNDKNEAPVTVKHGNISSDKKVAGTYIQLGIKKAVDWLMAADTTIPSNADFQAGATRIPIMVLMSDGEPTAANVNFHNPETSQMGCNSVGERSPAETDFLTQLTAGMAREMMDRHYVATTPLFYTLSLGDSISLNVMDPENNDALYKGETASGYTVETGRKHSEYIDKTDNTSPEYQNTPGVVNRKIQTYWNQILAGNSFSMTVLDSTANDPSTFFSTKVDDVKPQFITVDGETFLFPTSLSQKYYVDHHFMAEDADDLDDAFSRLVQEIRLQSSYYPTYVESNKAELDGYVTFLDEIGPNMEIKKVHGLIYGDMYYSGASYAYYISRMSQEGSVFGTFNNPTEYGWLVIDAIASRLNLTRDTARNVLRKSVEKNHVYYNANGASNGDYSNAFIWYADADANYVEVEHGQTPPQNARYLVTSYNFLDSTANANPDPSTLNAPLLYCSIRVAKDLTTGKQIVDWQVPAALIPTVNFDVTLSGNSLENPGEITVEYKPDSPLRAIYEVGLRSDVNPWNAQSLLGEQNRNPDGSYTFYTNDWNEATVGKPVSDTLRNQVNTIAYFQPSYQNERYLYTEDMPLYVKQGDDYVQYTGSSAPAENDGNTYYVRHSRFEWQWDDKTPVNAALDFHYHDASASLSRVRSGSGVWYIPGDTLHPFFTGDQYGEKSINNTETIDELYYTAMELFAGETTNHAVVTLGNNGKLSFIPSTGIALTKQVDAVPPGTTPIFTFTVENTSVPNGNYPVVYTDKDMNQLSGAAYPSAIAFTNGEATVQLRRNETIYLTGLPQGTYTITEQFDSLSNFNVGSVLVNGETVIDLYAVAVQVVSGHLTNVQYNNMLDTTGDVVIRKTVTHPFGDSYVLPEGLTFTFDIDLGTGYANKLITLQREAGDTGATAVSADANGILQDVTIMPGKPVMIPKLEPNTTVIVTEVNPSAGFTPSPASITQVTPEYGGVITFSFNNDYIPGKVDPVNIRVTGDKTLTGREWQPGDVFTFKLQKREGPDRWTDLGTKTVRFEDAEKTFDFTNEMRAFAFTAAGVYTFRVIEVPGMLPGITYDPTSCYFDVTVADSNMDGKLEISKVESGVNISLSSGKTGADNDHILNAHFTNQFTKADVILRKGMNDNSGQNLPVSGYTFGLYRDIDCKQLIASTTTGEDGTAAFETDELLYTMADLEGAQTKTFTYFVKEIVPDPPRYGMTYDSSLQQVNVTLNRNGEKLTVSVVPGSALLFTNSYDPDDAFVFLAGHKYFPGGALFDKAFRFDLYLADEQYSPALLLSSAYCAADGAYRFDPLQFTQTGTYRFTVQEDRSQKEPYVEYDESVYRIQVVVTDENGVLTPAVTVQHDLNGRLSLVTDPAKLDFTNTYQPPLTGDSANLGRWFMLMTLSAAGLLMLLRRRNA
ncbi:MAG: hypothetical protein IKJ26_05510 [Clostridia bacterium]|nr:hypothetical protein [Clostridia bacterium]